jgi:soluble cytochrome b562
MARSLIYSKWTLEQSNLNRDEGILMLDFTAAISAAKTGYEAAKQLLNYIRDRELRDLEPQIQELIGTLGDSRIALQEAQLELQEAQKNIQKLETILNTKESLTWNAPLYYLSDGCPICPACNDGQNIQARLNEDLDSRGSYDCMICKSFYTTRANEGR